MATYDKRSLAPAKKAYVIAAENALKISKLYPEKTHPIRKEMEKHAD